MSCANLHSNCTCLTVIKLFPNGQNRRFKLNNLRQTLYTSSIHDGVYTYNCVYTSVNTARFSKVLNDMSVQKVGYKAVTVSMPRLEVYRFH